MKRDSFIFYRSFFEAISELSDKDQLEIYKAISEYSLNFKCTDLKGISKTIFILIKPQLDANNKRYLNGTQPKKKQDSSKTEAKQKQNRSKNKANKNDNVNDNDNFNIFWESYHSITGKNKTDKESTLKYWNKLTNEECKKAIDKINDYSKTESENKYLKKARTYLSDKNFNDEFVNNNFTHVEYKFFGQAKIRLTIEKFKAKETAIRNNKFEIEPKYIKI